MPLVDYSSSDEECMGDAPSAATGATSTGRSVRDEKIEPAKKTELPPLPQTFHSLYATSSRTHPSDNPELHGGRTRQVPHVEGNWPTHVYLEWYPTRTELEMLQAIVDAANFNGQIHSLLQSELGAQLPLHISLSAPLILRGEQKSDFEERLALKIYQSGITPVELRIRSLRWERNFDATRWFLVLGLTRSEGDVLTKILECCNDCASIHDLPLLYDKTADLQTYNGLDELKMSKETIPNRTEAFHISIAWQLAEPSLKQRPVLSHFNVIRMGEETQRFEVVKVKMGNVVKDIPLGKKTVTGRS